MPYTSMLTDLHFADQDAAPPRVLIALDGLDKHGKTQFALSAPKPLVYLDFDIGKEGVLQKADDPDLVLTPEPFMFRTSEVTWDLDDAQNEQKAARIMAAAAPQLERFRKLYLHALTHPVMRVGTTAIRARSVVVDTGSEAWELLRQCYFGKLTKVMPHHYTECNSLMRDLVRAAYDSDVNVIWLHKLKAEWKEGSDGKSNKSNVLQRVGFGDMSYLVQANLLAYRVASNTVQDTIVKWKSGEALFELPIAARADGDLGFRLAVGNSRHDPALEGEVWFNEDINFANVAMRMRPDVDPIAWYTVRP